MDGFNGISFQILNFHMYSILTVIGGQPGAEAGGCLPLFLSLLTFHSHTSPTLQKRGALPCFTPLSVHGLFLSGVTTTRALKKETFEILVSRKPPLIKLHSPLIIIFLRDIFLILFKFYINDCFKSS